MNLSVEEIENIIGTFVLKQQTARQAGKNTNYGKQLSQALHSAQPKDTEAIEEVLRLEEEIDKLKQRNAELEKTLCSSHHIFCNYHNRRVGDCNCTPVMKKEYKELKEQALSKGVNLPRG